MTKQSDELNSLHKEIVILNEHLSSQKGMYEMTTAYLKNIQDELNLAKGKLEALNKDLTDSINYSKHIQDAFIVQIDKLREMIPNSFMFQSPKNIVSGDFTWAFADGEEIYLGVGDCTGHGVPGAMLSIFVISMLNEIISSNRDYNPAEILTHLDGLMFKYLTLYNATIRDSVEIAIIKLNLRKSKLTFASAKRPIVIIRNGELTMTKGTKYLLGDPYKRNEELRNFEFDLEKGDLIFLYSDGFADQFGGQNSTKFTNKRLLELLQSNSNLELCNQFEEIKETFYTHKGENSQIDDVLLLGFQI